jgi:hypothetical protein
LVAGASTPPPRASELATEALLGRVVDREPEVEGSPWGGGFQRAEVAVQQRRSTVSWHRDPDVAAYMHQVVTAGIAQAAARARFVRNPVLLIVVGLALDHLPPGSAAVKEWREIEPDDVDRMLIERQIAFGRSAGRKLFPWLSPGAARYIHRKLAEPSFLRERLEVEGWRIIPGKIRKWGQLKTVPAVRLGGPDGEGPDLAGLVREGFEWLDV